MTEEPVAKNFSINNMVIEERMRQGQPPPWHEEDERDSTKVDTYLGSISVSGQLPTYPSPNSTTVN